MEIEDQGDERDRKHQTAYNAPSQLVPHRKEGDLFAEALALDIASIQVVGHEREERAKHQLKHGCASPSWQRSALLAQPSRSFRPPLQPEQPFLHPQVSWHRLLLPSRLSSRQILRSGR